MKRNSKTFSSPTPRGKLLALTRIESTTQTHKKAAIPKSPLAEILAVNKVLGHRSD